MLMMMYRVHFELILVLMLLLMMSRVHSGLVGVNVGR